MAKKPQNINEVLRQVNILNAGVKELLKNKNIGDDDLDDENEAEETDETQDEAEEEVENEIDDEPETEETDDEVSDDDENESSDDEIESEEEISDDDENSDDDSENDDENESEDESENEVPEDSEEVLAQLSEKLDNLNENFNKFRGKVVSILEAILSTSKMSIGLKESENPRVVKEKKVLGVINTASGKLKTEVSALFLRMDGDGVLYTTHKDVFISKGTAVEEQLDIRGMIPNGNWVVVERKEKYYLVSTENFDFDDVTPYETEENDEDKETGAGRIVNKKGVAHNVKGYELEDNPNFFRLTKRSLEKPRRVFNAKWTKQDCDFPVKGEPIPEGTWVIVTDGEDNWYLVKSDDVQPKISTKRTEKEEPKKKVQSKKVPSKKSSKDNKKSGKKNKK